MERDEAHVDGRRNVKSSSRESGIGLSGRRIQHNVLSNMTSFLSLHFVQCVDCHVARKGGIPVDVVLLGEKMLVWTKQGSRRDMDRWTICLGRQSICRSPTEFFSTSANIC